jgi:hypothetical protein
MVEFNTTAVITAPPLVATHCRHNGTNHRIRLLSQPIDFQHFAIRALLKYLGSPSVDWRCVVLFIGEVLNRAAMTGATLNSVRRIIETLAPMLFAREDANGDLIHAAIDLSVAAIVRTVFEPERAHPMKAPKIAEEPAFWQRVLSATIVKARRFAAEHTVDELVVSPLNVVPVYCCVRPMYRVNEKVTSG